MKRRSALLIGFAILSSSLLIGRSTFRLPVAVASRPPATSPYARFVGGWFHHGGALSIHSNGHALYTYRLYVDCTTQRITACDKLTHNTIYGGGFSVFTLHRAGGNKAYGSMDNSVYSWQVGTTVTLVARPNDTLVLYEAGTTPITVCGARAPVGYCGA
jgi:hypothetical protein